MTYASPITATVKIEDTGGKLEATNVEYSPNAEFVNTFDAEGTWAPDIFKIFTGRDMREDERYEVTVTDQDGNTVMTGTAEAGVNGEPKAFTLTPEKITYTEEDVVNFEPTTYTYTITETVGSESGVTYTTTYNGYDVINTLNHTPPTHDDVALKYWIFGMCASAVMMLAAAFGLRRRERKS